MKKTLIMILCVLAATLTLTACGGIKPQKLYLKELPKTVYVINEDEKNFTDSLKNGLIIIRYSNNTDKIVPMNDEKLILSGFTTESIGVRHVTIKHADYDYLELKFSYEVVDVAPMFFEITTNPDRTTYPNNVKTSGIDLSGIEIKVTNNNGTSNSVEQKTNADFTVIQIEILSHTEGEVSIRLNGTNMIEKFTITLTEAEPTDPNEEEPEEETEEPEEGEGTEEPQE